MSATRIRILLVDDHYLVRMGIKSVIETDPTLSIIGEAEDGPAAVEAARSCRPDIVLMDLRMPGGGGLEATLAICSELPASRVIMLTTYFGDEDIHQALEAGARGYILKNIAGAEMLKAIHEVHGGARHIPAPVARRLAERIPASDLSPKQFEVLQLLAKGFSNKRIGELLGTGESTIRSHVSAILAKLGVEDRTEAVVVALERGILHLD